MPSVKKGATDQSFYFMLVDSTDGTPESDYTITSLDATYVRDRAAAVKNDLTALTTISDAHTDNKGYQVSKTTALGLYRVDYPDAAFSDSATVDRVQLVVTGTGLHPAVIEVELEKYDISDVVVKIDSDAVLYLADHDKTQSDVADLSTKVDSDSVLYLADHDKTQSDIADLSTKVDSDALLVHTIVKQDSDMVVLIAEHDATQAKIDSDTTLLNTKLDSDMVVLIAEHDATQAKVDSDSLLYLADHDKTQSDIADLSTKVDSDAVLADADHDKTQSDIADVRAETAKIYSDTTEINTATTKYTSDVTKTPLSDLATATALAAVSTKVDSDSVLYIADHDKTQSDLADLSAKVDSDALLVHTIVKQDSDMVLLIAEHDATQAKIDSDALLVYTAAKADSDMLAISGQADSDMVLLIAEHDATQAKVDSDSLLYLADHDKTQSDVAGLSTKVDSDSVLYLADHDKTQSDVAEVKAETAKIYSDTTVIEATGGALTAGQASDLAAIEAELIIVHSETTEILTDTGTTLPTKIDSDALLYLADHDKTQSDIALINIGAGSGARTISATVNDGTDPLEGAVIRLSQNGISKARATTDASGEATLNVDDGTYTVAITCSGYTFSGATLVVSGDATPDAYSMTLINSTPPATPDKSVVTFTCYGDTDGSGDTTQAESGVTIQLKQNNPPDSDTDHTFDGSVYSYTSDANGQIVLTLWLDAYYSWRRGTSGRWTDFQPDTANYSISSIVGADA